MSEDVEERTVRERESKPPLRQADSYIWKLRATYTAFGFWTALCVVTLCLLVQSEVFASPR
jgi:hypothetical protein